MKKQYSQLILVILFLGSTFAHAASTDTRLHDKTVVRFLDVNEATKILTQRDNFITMMSPFDRSARLKTDRKVTREEFLEFVSQQIVSWKISEIKKLRKIVREIGELPLMSNLNLPKIIPIIKTTGGEEGQAAYHRSEAIVLPQNIVDSSPEMLQRIIIHEIFHVFISYNPEIKQSLYGIIGFKPCGTLQLPVELSARKITNPDVPINDFCITIKFKGKPVVVFPILFSRTEKYEPHRGGEFFNYLVFKLIAVEKKNDKWVPKYLNNNLILIDALQTESFLEKIGKNTNYIIHPEEILADNFVLYIKAVNNVPTPRIIIEIGRILRALDVKTILKHNNSLQPTAYSGG